MNYHFIYKLSAAIFLIFVINTKFVAADLPTIPLDIDSKTFCVKDPDSFERDYHHVMILIDRTSYLAEEQIEWIKDELFNETFAKEYRPYTRFSVLFIDNKSPQKQEVIYSKCRPKSGKKSKDWDDEKYTSNENKLIVGSIFNTFVNGKNDVVGFNNLSDTIGTTVEANNSYIFETIIHSLRTKSLNFRDRDYDKRTLIIVSDLMQHSKEFSLYKECKAKTNIKQMSKCPTLEKSLSKNKVLNDYLTFTKPKETENLEVKLFFLNFKHETNREISVSLIDFWGDYFRMIGISIPRSIEDWTTWQTNF